MSRRMAPRWTFLCALLTLCATAVASAAAPAEVGDVRLWSGPEGTRLVLDLSAPVRHEVFSLENPDRIVTSEDYTVYFINVPANKLELWFWMESDRLLNPVFREFYSER